MQTSNLKELFIRSINSGLKRKSITTCSKWAENYRVIGTPPYPGPWSFKNFPWLKDMHDSEAEMNIGQKAAQMGFTEWALNKTFYYIDIKNRDVLYVLPAKTPDAGDFSAARFDAALELSPHLANLFSDVKNIGHKRAGSANLYIRGSRSRSGLKSIPVGLVIMDEVDEMTQENIPLAFERTSGQLEKFKLLLSTPTIEAKGINQYYQQSSQNHFFFKCPGCNRYTELKYPESLVICGDNTYDLRKKETHLICHLCNYKLDHKLKSEYFENNQWVEAISDRDMKGWHISQLYSTTVSPLEIAESYFSAQNDYSDEQELHNSKLGLTHEVKGARITDEQINLCRKNYTQHTIATNNMTTMGVDVGHPWIHFEIDDWGTQNTPRLIAYGKCQQFEDLDILMKQFRINFCVIDAHPERRKAFEFSQRFLGIVRLCFYVVGINGKQLHISDAAEPSVSVDRTSWLDLSIGRFKAQNILLPKDIDLEYRKHIKALVRIYSKDKNGNPVGTYENVNPDHYAHARNYSEIAFQLGIGVGKHQDIKNIL